MGSVPLALTSFRRILQRVEPHSRQSCIASERMNANGRWRVLYVQKPRGGGSATGLYDLVRLLNRDRFEAVVLFYYTNRYCQAFRDLGARVIVLEDGLEPGESAGPGAGATFRSGSGHTDVSHRIARLTGVRWNRTRHISEIAQRESVDLVHHNNNPAANRDSILGAWLAGVKQVAHVRFLRDYSRVVDPILSSRVAAFVFMSRAIGDQCASSLGIGPDRGQVVYDPIDLETFAPQPDARDEIFEDLGLPAECLPVVNVGRLVEWKGLDIFLRAMSRIVGSDSRAHGLVVGSAPQTDAGRRYEESLRRLARNLDLEDHVTFTGFRGDVERLMAASEVVVHSATRPEPFGRVVVEAMACGRPVVSMAAGGPLEIVEDGRTGRLVAPGDPAEMADAVLDLLRDPEEARSMGERARRAAELRFGEERFARSIHELYERVLREERPWG